MAQVVVCGFVVVVCISGVLCCVVRFFFFLQVIRVLFGDFFGLAKIRSLLP